MSIDNITFEKEDTLKETATKTVLLYAGSHNLKKELAKLKVDYTKVNRGNKVIFVLRHSSFGREEVVL